MKWFRRRKGRVTLVARSCSSSSTLAAAYAAPAGTAFPDIGDDPLTGLHAAVMAAESKLRRLVKEAVELEKAQEAAGSCSKTPWSSPHADVAGDLHLEKRLGWDR